MLSRGVFFLLSRSVLFVLSKKCKRMTRNVKTTMTRPQQNKWWHRVLGVCLGLFYWYATVVYLPLRHTHKQKCTVDSVTWSQSYSHRDESAMFSGSCQFSVILSETNQTCPNQVSVTTSNTANYNTGTIVPCYWDTYDQECGVQDPVTFPRFLASFCIIMILIPCSLASLGYGLLLMCGIDLQTKRYDLSHQEKQALQPRTLVLVQ